MCLILFGFSFSKLKQQYTTPHSTLYLILSQSLLLRGWERG